jgi:hypothetical protein
MSGSVPSGGVIGECLYGTRERADFEPEPEEYESLRSVQNPCATSAIESPPRISSESARTTTIPVIRKTVRWDITSHPFATSGHVALSKPCPVVGHFAPVSSIKIRDIKRAADGLKFVIKNGFFSRKTH